MNNVPEDLKYTRTHEWVRLEGDETVTVGISAHAQDLLGDMVFVEVPEVGREIHGGEECAVVESVKAASDVYAPLGGEVIEVNEMLEESPDTINRDPYGDGWLFRIRPSDPSELEGLLDADAYQELVEEESH